MMRGILALLLLASCAVPAQDVHDCGCVEMESAESVIARTGFPPDLIYAEGAKSNDTDGTTLTYVQYDAAQATKEMIAASPAAQCAGEGLALVSSKVVPPGPDDMEIEGSMIVRAICK